MKWIKERLLFQINQELSSLAQDGVYAKVELWSYSSEDFAKKEFEKSSEDALSELPSEHFEAMKATIAISFPDFDFSKIAPWHFKRVSTNEKARTNLNWSISTYFPDGELLSSHLWQAIESTILPMICDVYSYEPDYSDAFSEMGANWCSNLLFIDSKHKKVLLCHIREGAKGFESMSESDNSQDERYGCSFD